MSHYFEWVESYSVGVHDMDQDHRVLVQLVDEAIMAIQSHAGAEVGGDILYRLLEYAVAHFRREEALMEQAGYPQLVEHRAAHNRLVRQAAELLVDYRNGRLNPGEVGEFLMDWLLRHILEADKRYTESLNAHGIR